MNLEEIENFLKSGNQPKFRLGQIAKAVFIDNVSTFSEISNIPIELRENLDQKIGILSFKANKILISSDKKSIKAKLKLADENYIETVLLSTGPGVWSACISSQIGCPMSCAFCATGLGGFKRNLTAEEITDQVLFWRQYMRKNKIPGRLSNIVYMGMGEPFLNWDAVKESLKILTDNKWFGLGSRSLSISTVGITDGINRLVSSFPQVNLAVSLHFCEDPKRNEFMPANRSYNLENLKADLGKYFMRANRKVFLEYILFRHINDSLEDARKLVEFIKGFQKPRLLHINLIRYNESGNSKIFEPSSEERMLEFQKYLLKNNLNCTMRKSLGLDIQGACGQLAVTGYIPII